MRCRRWHGSRNAVGSSELTVYTQSLFFEFVGIPFAVGLPPCADKVSRFYRFPAPVNDALCRKVENTVRDLDHAQKDIARDRRPFLKSETFRKVFRTIHKYVVRAPCERVNVKRNRYDLIGERRLKLLRKVLFVRGDLQRIASEVVRFYARFEFSLCPRIFRY